MSIKTKIAVTLTVLLSACSTIFSGSSQTITFDSNVKENIEIYANGALVCSKTPCTVDIDRISGPMTIIAKAKGYEDSVMQDKTKINPIFWANILLIYPTGSTTDFATSSMWKYSQDGIYINMKPKENNHTQNLKFKKDTEIRKFAVYNFGELKYGNREYLSALEELTGQKTEDLKLIITQANTEAELANTLTNI